MRRLQLGLPFPVRPRRTSAGQIVDEVDLSAATTLGIIATFGIISLFCLIDWITRRHKVAVVVTSTAR